MTKREECWRYISRIRNPDKREYAIRYMESLLRVQPEPDECGLSYMAAQAVRMQINAIVYPA